jgi:argininosuccinate synthase
VKERGRLAGAAEVRVVDAVDRFAAEVLMRAIKANALYEQMYPLVSGLARPLIADEVVRVAREVGTDVVAHGCTGKGNDQVRFEVSFAVLAPTCRSSRRSATTASRARRRLRSPASGGSRSPTSTRACHHRRT